MSLISTIATYHFLILPLLASPDRENSTTHQPESLSRQKRFLIFPRGNPTRHQLVAGFGIPVDLVLESITVGYVFKAVYFLPYNETHLIPPFLNRDEANLEPPAIQLGQWRNFVERPPAPEEEVGQQSEDEGENESARASSTDGSRWSFYKMLEAIGDQKGYNGRSCLLRTICEAAEARFSHSNGILGELLHILFTPSTSADHRGRFKRDDTTEEDPLHREYRRAELLAHQHSGRSPDTSICSDMFADCPFSLLGLFSEVTKG
ncbi:uncharacterized protein LOC129753897 [Uranotaenia lowii]|uniref:uncharacterized protein LOC129753897 n=1 Tax=Uranotaenia lowii TaxID=190385 RepID=UPI0024794FEE|nr:uncharacterized protein LOC129753897 [Uranotaenia lowii]